MNTCYCRLTDLKRDNQTCLVMMKQKFLHLSGEYCEKWKHQVDEEQTMYNTFVLDGVEHDCASKENNETEEECSVEENSISDEDIQQRLVHVVYQRQPKPDPEKAEKNG